MKYRSRKFEILDMLLVSVPIPLSGILGVYLSYKNLRIEICLGLVVLGLGISAIWTIWTCAEDRKIEDRFKKVYEEKEKIRKKADVLQEANVYLKLRLDDKEREFKELKRQNDYLLRYIKNE